MAIKFIQSLTKGLLHSPFFWLAGTLVLASIATNLGADESRSKSDKEAAKPAAEAIIREGTRVESRTAECRAEGERLVLQMADSKRHITALENLASQRILKSVMDEPSDNQWIVTGSITEFQGRNFLLIERVSRVSRK